MGEAETTPVITAILRALTLAPTPVDYVIDAQLVLYTNVDATSVRAIAQANPEAYKADRAAGFDRDVVPSQKTAAPQVAGVYQVILDTPMLKQPAENEWACCTASH